MSIPNRIHKIMGLLKVFTLIVSLILFLPLRAYAATTWTVTDANDVAGSASDITLRYAMTHAQSGDTINFADSLTGHSYYTTDGSDPVTSGTRKAYDGLIPVSQTVTIKAVNHTSAGWSDVTTSTFNIGGTDSLREPVIFPNEGSFTGPQTVYIYGYGVDWLYYTTDGSDPKPGNSNTVAFQGAYTTVTVSKSETIKVIAQYSTSGLSNMASASFSIGGSGPLTAPVITPNGGSFSSPLMVDIYNRSGTIYLSSPLPKINKNLTIAGPGAESLAISGNYKSRIFEVDGGNVSISGITIENGYASGNSGSDGYNGIAGGGGGGGGAATGGGGLLIKGGTVIIDGVDFLYNRAVGGSGGSGGAGFTGGDDYGDGGNGAASDLHGSSTGGQGGIAPFSAFEFGIFQLSSARAGFDASDGAYYGGGGGGSGINSDKEPSGYSKGGQGGQDVNGTIGTGPNGGSFNPNGSKGGNGGAGGAASVTTGTYYGGNGGNGGDAYGGAISVINGAVQILNSSFVGNGAIGGMGGAGGISYQAMKNGVSLDSFIWSVGGMMLSGNRGSFDGWRWVADLGLSGVGNGFSYMAKGSTAYPFGGYPGNGGNGEGGAIYVSPYNSSFGWNGAPLIISNSTFMDNGAYGGKPGLVTNWTGITGSFGQYFADDIANKTNSSYIAVRNVTGLAGTLGDIRTLSGPSAAWSKITASSLNVTADGTTSVTIMVSLRDANNMPVWGDKVILNQGNGHSRISPASTITDIDGNAVFTVTNTKAETVAYTATEETNLTISGKNLLLWDGYKNVETTESTVAFTPGLPSAVKSAVSASPSAVPSNGIDSAVVQVTIVDAGGNPLTGKTVILEQGAGSSNILPASTITDSNGTAAFTVTDAKSEQVTYTARVTKDNVTLSQTASVTFSAYAWVVDSLSDTDTLGTLRYAIKNAPSGNTITFKSGISGTIWLSGPLPPINKELTISGPGAGSLTISGNNLYRVFEVNGGNVYITGVTIANGKASGINGADGSYSSSGAGTDGGSGTNGSGGAMLMTGGTVSFDNVTFSGNSAVGGSGGRGGNPGASGTYNYWAGNGGNGGSGIGGAISMTGGTLSVTNSTFTGNTATGGSAGNGGDASKYSGYGGNGGSAHGGAISVTSGTVTASNNLYTNNKVSGGNGGNGGTSWSNQHNGYYGGVGGNGYGGSIYISTTSLTITDSQFSGDSVTGGNRGTGINSNGAAGSASGLNIFNQTGPVIVSNVSFDTGNNSYIDLTPADPVQSTITVSPTDVVSDGTSFSKITVKLKGANGSPLGSGKTVTLSQGSGSSGIKPASAVTDSSGTVTFAVTSSRAQTVTYTARVVTDNVTLAQTAVEDFLPPDTGQSTVTASPDGVKADGRSKSMITVTLKYTDGSPAVGKTVTLDQGSGTSVIFPASAVTDSKGAATFSVSSLYPRTLTYTARDTTDNMTLSNQAAVTFNPYLWIVNTLTDTGDFGTLRDAINNAPSGSTIKVLDGLTGTITLQSPLPVINKDLTIDGNGTNVMVSGNNRFRVLEVDGGIVSVKDITIAYGKVTGSNGANPPGYDHNGGIGANGSGGGLLVMNGTVSIKNVSFNYNNATGGLGGTGNGGTYSGGTGGNGLGGAIYLNAGSLVIIDSRFGNNSAVGGLGGYGEGYFDWFADGGTGGDGYGGAIYVNDGSLSISNSQFDGNQVTPGSGGITLYYVRGQSEHGSPGRALADDMYVLNGTATVNNVTFDPRNNTYYNPSPADAGQSVITASPNGKSVNGITTYRITVLLKGVNGSTVGSGRTVTLTPDKGSSVISPVNNGLTDNSGTATFTVTDTQAESVAYTAKDTTYNVTLTQTAVVNFDFADLILTYTAGDHGSITGTTTQTVKYGQTGNIVTAVPDTGYHFVKWSDGLTTAVRTDSNVTDDINVTAVFAADTFDLSYTAGGHGSITGNTLQTVNFGESGAVVEAVPDAGYHFVSWSDGSKDNPRTDANVAQSINVTANFAKSLEILTLSMPAGSVGKNYSSILEAIGGDMPYSWSAAGLPDGLEIETVTGEVYGIPTVSGIYTANFTVTDYVYETGSIAINIEITPDSHFVSVSAVPAEGGTVSRGGKYAEGTSVTVTAAANDGFGFVDWTENGAQVSTNSIYTFTLGAEDRHLSAKFELIQATDADKVAADKAALTWDAIRGANSLPDSVTSDLNLTVTGAVYGSTITWSSDNTAVISNSGVVTRPAYASYDANATVTATVYINGVSDTKGFYLTVLKLQQLTLQSIAITAPATKLIYTVGESLDISGLEVTGYYSDGSSQIESITAANVSGFDSSQAVASQTLTVTVGGRTATYTVTISTAEDGYNYSDDSNDSDNSGGGSSTTAPTTSVVTKDGTITATITTPSGFDNSGKAAVTFTQDQMRTAVSQAITEAAKQGADKTVVTISIVAPTDVAVEVAIPRGSLNEVAAAQITELAVNTPVAAISFDSKAISTITGEAASDVKITVARVEISALSPEAQQAIGDRPVYNFSVTSGDKTISQFNGNVKVTVPYTPKAGEDPEAIVIYYINTEGQPEIVKNSKYDPVTGTVTFNTTHFSKYAVGYNKANFSDVSREAWYSKAVNYVAARGISAGIGNGQYGPEAKLTRGQFLTMLMNAYGIEAEPTSADNFIDAGNTYYTGYLATAKRLGIAGGVGNNRYAPDRQITRQEMFTLMYNALKVINKLPQDDTGKPLSAFSDAGQIAPWAKEAMNLMTKTGIIKGSGGKLAPEDTTTRAQMAQVLYTLLSK